MDVNEAISGRRSVREYTAQAIDDTAIRRLIAAAMQAPSAVNQQPWTFIVVRDQVLLDRISRKAKSHMLATMPADAHAGRFRSLLDDPDFHVFYHAPALIVIAAASPGPWMVESCALAAQDLDASCLCGGAGFVLDRLRPEFPQFARWARKASHRTSPPECVPVAPIIIGHPKAATPPVPRKDADIRWIG